MATPLTTAHLLGRPVRRPGDPAPRPGVTDPAEAARRLAEVVGRGGAVVLSGAGLSTDSGIPDYRGPRGSLRRHTPMTYQEFTAAGAEGEAARRRYWARSHVGWRVVARSRPNDGHRAVAAMEARGRVTGTITQNVDGLHQAGGSRDVVELHGSLDRVVCLSCRATSDRGRLDDRLRLANEGWRGSLPEPPPGEVNPDGDVDLPEEVVTRFVVVPCESCGSGPLKPDVVFFGESVPRPRVDDCFARVDAARTLLVLGSSLTVMSGYRFVLHARRAGTPVVVLVQGETRADATADLRLDAPLTPVLVGAVRLLG
ncbi:NAD-dependent SIR2 family protein deacetylase [Pseudokineococcus lusitanus]|uniref:NAD-dependent protein deacetylase n=1 Tax=Pseudokineococcus lusitanus TaxID=763993 RepID=A0A3N1HTD6_9ACTN|nr:NAD-dependent protein deacetylase [Pseudokineococcus lusitanus]ROP45656.1 NAD-dependent SIR2 family protein deacetylase [Pseudokineococcus lusitanus]